MNLPPQPARAAASGPLRASRWPEMLLALTALLAATAALGTAGWIGEREEADTAGDIARADARIVQRMSVYIAQLRSVAALFAAAGDAVDHERFRRFAAALQLEQYPGIQGIGWVRRLEPGSAEHAGQGAADERTAVVYLEPLDARNRAALGYDMYSEPTRREAMRRARDTGEPAMSGRVRLVQEIAGAVQPGFLIYVPVYRGGAIPSTVAARREQLIGFAYAPFRATDLFDAILEGEAPELSVEVFDDGSLDEPDRLYGGQPADLSRSEIVRRRIAGHPWTLRITPLERRVATSVGAAAVVLVLGVGLALAAYRAARGESEARLRAEQALAREAREAQFREVFLGMLGHDLRNPLQAILMTARMLEARGGETSPEERRGLERIVASTSRANRMVSQLLDMARARVGEGIPVRREPVDVATLTREAAAELRAAHPARAIDVDVDEGDELLRVRGDSDRLAQVLGNLGANAITHGDPAHAVRFRAYRRPNGEVVVEVWNAAAPIPDEIAAALFDPFSRGHAAHASASEGLGLGLYIGDQIARAHGGRVELASNDARGITFALVLPRRSDDTGAADRGRGD